jgi:hypothetical protein
MSEMISKTSWLKCKVATGLFTNEYTVLCTTFEGKAFSLYAPVSAVQLIGPTLRPSVENNGLIRVKVLDSSNEFRLIALPAKPLDASQTVKVMKSQLVAA